MAVDLDDMVGLAPSTLARLLWLVLVNADQSQFTDAEHGAVIGGLMALDLDPGLGNPDALTELFR